MLRNALIFFTACIGLICLIMFATTYRPIYQSPSQLTQQSYGTVQLQTAELGELAIGASGIVAGDAKGSLHHFPLPLNAEKRIIFPLSVHAISAPILDYNGTCYVGDEAGMFHAYNLDQGLKWTYKTGNRITVGAVYAEGLILVGSYDQKLYALTPDLGQLIYTVECDSFINSTPVLSKSGKNIFLGSCDGTIRRINTKTGEITGRIDLFSPIPDSPILYDDTLYVVTHGGKLVAIKTDSFELHYEIELHSSFTSSPYVTDRFIFLTDTKGQITVHTREGGNILSVLEDKDEMTPLKASRHGEYYAVSTRGKLHQYIRQEDQWVCKHIHDFQTDCKSSCVIFGNICFIKDTNGGLYYYKVSP